MGKDKSDDKGKADKGGKRKDDKVEKDKYGLPLDTPITRGGSGGAESTDTWSNW